LEFNYLTIQLNQLNWRDYLKQKNPVAAALMSKMKIDPSDRVKAKVACLRSIATLKLDPARMSILAWFVDSYLSLDQTETLEFQANVDKIGGKKEKEQVMQMVTSWMIQGELQATLKSVRRVLLHQIGAIEPAIDQQLQSMPVEQLETLFDAALDFKNQQELIDWLANQ
jgi:Domain of unknown function (DUF4351)